MTHPNHFYEPFYILNFYAPAHIPTERKRFYEQLYTLLRELAGQVPHDRLIIAGDFNYSHSRDSVRDRFTPTEWVTMLDVNYLNCMSIDDSQDIPTFHRKQRDSHIYSTIDYIYAGPSFHNQILSTSILPIKWSDHSILSIHLVLGPSLNGNGLWRANPAYALQKPLQKQLHKQLTELITSLAPTGLTTAEKWDHIKVTSQTIIRKYGIKYVSWRKKTIHSLEKRRNMIMRTNSDPALRLLLIPPIDEELHRLQEELTQIAILKAGNCWREKGEKDAGFLKRIHQQRTVQQSIEGLRRPEIATVSTNPEDMRNLVKDYYQALYTRDDIDPDQLSEFLSHTDRNVQVDDDENDYLVGDITIDELLEQVKRCPKHSSPGNDGLGYQFLQIIFSIPAVQPIVLDVFNRALTAGDAPLSWKDIRIRLLPKKGDLTLLKNWRPISLINCDAKVFTRILNQRLKLVIGKLIQPFQTGFMEGRFIGDNGMMAHLLLQQARVNKHPGLGILLDQEKAYDRVHPTYLCKVLKWYGFSDQFVHCIHQLFFNNLLQVNVNGFFTMDIHQMRGLRQGDPLSPTLFNLALEPLLLAIQQDPLIRGYPFPSVQHQATYSIKTIAYTDDVCVILDSPEEWPHLQRHLTQYAAVSNAKFNQDKTEAFSLSGEKSVEWLSLLTEQSISTYYHKHSSTSFRYLGYHLVYTIQQRQQLEETLIAQIQKLVNFYSQRNLSVRGRATIMNTLILSKIWFCLRIFNPRKSFFKKLQSMIYQFVWQKKKPLIAFSQLCLPLHQGGLGLLHPARQHLVLQQRFLQQLFAVPENDQSCPFKEFFQYHLHRLKPTVPLATISFFVPVWRKNDLNHTTSIINAVYTAFDLFNTGRPAFDFASVQLHTLLQVPLKFLLDDIPDGHWIHRHPYLDGSSIFIWDLPHQCLRLKVQPEYQQSPQLLRRLFIDIMVRRTVKLKPFMWDYILNENSQAVLHLSDTSLHPQFLSNPLWLQFESKIYRLHQYEEAHQRKLPIRKKLLQDFWKLKLNLPARNLWYRVLNKKVPHRSYLIYIHNEVTSTTCPLCDHSTEEFVHFLVTCPIKASIWRTVLYSWYPHLSFTPDHLLDILTTLRTPSFFSSTERQQFLSNIGVIQFSIWSHYWLQVIKQVPFDLETVLDAIFRTQSQLSFTSVSSDM